GAFTGSVSLGGLPPLTSPTPDMPFVAKFDAKGVALFAVQLSGVNISLAYNPSTGGAFFGATLPSPQSSGYLYVGELDDAGAATWTMTYGGTELAILDSITLAPSGDLFISGASKGPLNFGTPIQNHGVADMFLARLSS